MDHTINAAFRIKFDPAWVLSKRGDSVLPVERVIAAVEKELGAKITSKSLTECQGTLVVPPDLDLVEDRLEDIVRELYSLSDDKNFSVIVEEVKADGPAPADERETASSIEGSASPQKKEEPAQPPKPGKTSAIERIRSLIGASAFKELAEETVKIAPVVRKYGTFETVTGRCCLISVNDGCGLSTYLELYADLLEELELFRIESKVRIAEVRLPPKKGDGVGEALKNVKEALAVNSKSRVVCVDISEWMTGADDIDFRKFLTLCAGSAGHHVVFFRVPFVERTVLEDLRQDLNDMVFVRSLSLVPFDPEEIDLFADKILAENGFTMDDEAREIFRERIAEEKNDGRFYGIKTVKKVVREMLYRMQLSEAETGIGGSCITKDQITGLSQNESTMGLSGMEMLDQLVGMDSIKDQVLQIVAQIVAHSTNESLEAPCIHMRFVGDPGTGKTTVARIVGKILREKGILRNGSFLEHSGRDLCGRFVGETAPRTAAMCRDAYGSVLFIDEAYSLYRDDSFSNADYGREALDTLIAEMENHRSDLVVIMAGYPQEMEDLMKANPGLASRMPYKVEFPDYTRDQLSEIFLSMARKSFTLEAGFEEAVRSYFDSLSSELMDRKDFSNARYVRNLFERTWAKAALRCQMLDVPCTTLTAEDFSLSSGEKDFQLVNDKKKSRTIGFI
ncbi:MAG: AAA family ATPase [Ruminococcus sp.]|nr:AAA family ATPase [Ruminococcus sp.]